MFVDVSNARVDEQRQVMEKIVEANECPFCQSNLEKYHREPILMESHHWLVTRNQWPYEHTSFHFLLIAKVHVEHLRDLPAEAGTELIELVKKLDDLYHFEGGGLAIRFGSTQYSAGTVAHLHAQIVIPDVQAPDFEPVRIKIGTRPQLG